MNGSVGEGVVEGRHVHTWVFEDVVEGIAARSG